MDQKTNSYIESLILEVLQMNEFANFSDEQKSKVGEKLRDNFNNVVWDTTVDKLTPQQLQMIKDIPVGSSQMEEKIEEFSSQIPFLITEIEKNLTSEVEKIKSNPLAWAI